MFALPRRVVCSQNLKNLTKNFRILSSDQSQQIRATQSFNDTNSNDIEQKKDYGEKEIFLLSPVDIRAPLPGHTGVELSVSFQDVPNRVQGTLRSNEKSVSLLSDSAEGRLRNTMTQLEFSILRNLFSSDSELEFVAYKCPQLLQNDFSDLFPEANIKKDSLVVLTVCHRTKNDMKMWSEPVEEERTCLEKGFIVAATALCTSLNDVGFWADFLHPTTGQAALGRSSSKATMFETDIRYKEFGFSIEDLGCCKVISHHRWGTHVYVGAIFTTAPLDRYGIQAIMPKYSALC